MSFTHVTACARGDELDVDHGRRHAVWSRRPWWWSSGPCRTTRRRSTGSSADANVGSSLIVAGSELWVLDHRAGTVSRIRDIGRDPGPWRVGDDPTEHGGPHGGGAVDRGTTQWFYENKMSFNTLMAQQPQTLSSPARPESACRLERATAGGGPGSGLRVDQRDGLWLTERRRRWLYYDNAAVQPLTEPTTVPIDSPRSAVTSAGSPSRSETTRNIVGWTPFESGGHRWPAARVAGRRREESSGPALSSTSFSIRDPVLCSSVGAFVVPGVIKRAGQRLSVWSVAPRDGLVPSRHRCGTSTGAGVTSRGARPRRRGRDDRRQRSPGRDGRITGSIHDWAEAFDVRAAVL